MLEANKIARKYCGQAENLVIVSRIKTQGALVGGAGAGK